MVFARSAHSYYIEHMIWILLLLIPASMLVMLGTVIQGGPRSYDLLAMGSALLLFWAWINFNWWAGAAWFLLYAGCRLAVSLAWPRRVKATNAGATGTAQFISFVSLDKGKRPLVIFLPPLRGPLFWLAGKVNVPLPQAGNKPFNEVVLPVLRQFLGASRGFRLDTRHLRSIQPDAPAIEIRCD